MNGSCLKEWITTKNNEMHSDLIDPCIDIADKGCLLVQKRKEREWVGERASEREREKSKRGRQGKRERKR